MSTPTFRHVLLAAACLADAAQAQMVKPPPPLPPGATLARPEPGMSEPERKRAVRAHHHKFENGKDYTRDDSVAGPGGVAPAAVQPTGTRAPGGALPGGAGTGPAREKTDKGASSYFFGTDKK